MATPYALEIHAEEDNDKVFDVAALLAQAGAAFTGPLTITSMAESELLYKVDADTIAVTPYNVRDWHGSFDRSLRVTDGAGQQIDLDLHVVVDAMNDSPEGRDGSVALTSVAPYTVREADFGFSDSDGDAFAALLVVDKPRNGDLLLNGTVVDYGQRIDAADIRAGKLVFAPHGDASGTSGLLFRVIDDGGTPGNDIDYTPATLSFSLPDAAAFSTEIHASEDNDKVFEIADLLAQAGATVTGPLTIRSITQSELFYKIDDDTVAVTPYNRPNWNGSFDERLLVTDGAGRRIQLDLHVVVEQVNDSPEGSDKTVARSDFSPYVLKESDFGFSDLEGDGFLGVHFLPSPSAGYLSVPTSGTVSLEDIRDGKVAYTPAANANGPAPIRFLVVDDGDPPAEDTTAKTLTLDLPSRNAASLGDRVWYDINLDGLQGAGEPGASGVVVKLRGAGMDNRFDDITRPPDDTYATTTTDADGHYRFTDLAPGMLYKVSVEPPPGYGFAPPDRGSDDTLDSDLLFSDRVYEAQVLRLGDGESNTALDIGLVPSGGISAWIGGNLRFDFDGDGSRLTGTNAYALVHRGVPLELRGAGLDNVLGNEDDTFLETTTSASGHYAFSYLHPGATYQLSLDDGSPYRFSPHPNISSDGRSLTLIAGTQSLDAELTLAHPAGIGDRIWYDADRDGLWGDGVESGAQGVKVTLHSAGADGLLHTADDVVASTVTDETGLYRFDHLVPGTPYQVAVEAPSGYRFSDMTPRDPYGRADSSAVDAEGRSPVLTLSETEYRPDIDAGLVPSLSDPASIEGRTWEDVNGNGLRDAGEPGTYTTVSLTGTTQYGSMALTTVTDEEGRYRFEELPAGSYIVHFSDYGYHKPAPANQGSDDRIDSDADDRYNVTLDLVAGQHAQFIDIGLVPLASPFGLNIDAALPPLSATLLDSGNTLLDTAFGAATASPFAPAEAPVSIDSADPMLRLASHLQHDALLHAAA